MSELNMRKNAALQLKNAAVNLEKYPSLLGFDGFVDYIIRMVDKKKSRDDVTYIPTISSLADRLQRAAGMSSNIELRVQQVKLGGNGPIMANAMGQFGLPITYFGPLGQPELHPAFIEFGEKAKVYSLAEPATTDALEFEDGKIMMGKHEPLQYVNYKNIINVAGEENFNSLWQDSKFVGMVNWTMLDAMTDIWKNLLANQCPKLAADKSRTMFFDLADPEKRSTEDIREALNTIAEFAKYYTVIFGVNEKESDQIAEVLGLAKGENTSEFLQQRAAAIRTEMGVQKVVIHPVKFAVAADENGTASVQGPYVEKPLISTGAGDHFNAGFSLGTLLGLDIQTSLFVGVSTSGFYVRTAKSPSVPDLVNFLETWD